TQNITRIEVVSATGQIMHETEVNEESVSINVENLPSGTYFVRIFCNPNVIVKKLVVM
ncbi:MAG: T9SS type A sorting domain-containing protein, partial [Bacteroidales bacterium]|nr:T9SS type A sorting domain-containing protein [Bacteroidales bacterium]